MKKTVLSALTIVCAFLLLAGCAQGPSMDGFVYSTNDNKLTITNYNGKADKAELPASYNDKAITAIGKKAFSDTALKSITFPESIITIDPTAFVGSSVQNIFVNEDNVKFSAENGILYNKNKDTLIAFAPGKTDTGFDFPDTVRAVGSSAFEGNAYIEGVNFNSVKYIEDRAFFKCSALKSIDIPLSVASIGRIAFAGCSQLESIKLPSGIQSIDETAFMDCPNLKSIKVYEGTFAEQWCKDNGYESIMEYA